MAITNLTAANFDSVVAEGTVLVDFWAAWCGPCKMVAPIVEAIDEKHGDKVKVCKVDVDAEMALAQRFGVTSIPTIIVFSDGKEASKVVGVQPMETLEKMVLA